MWPGESVAKRGKKTAVNKRRRQIWFGVAVLLILFAAAGAWKWTPLADQIDIRKITIWVHSIRDNPGGPLIILAAYLAGSVLIIPITVLILATALVFGPLLGCAYSFVGCFLGAAVTYAIGYFLGRNFIQRVVGSKWQRVEQKIDQAGIMGVATMRLLPVAPFTIVNLVSGAFQVKFRDYIIGSLLGMAPGIVVINLFAQQFESAVRNPGLGSYTLLVASVVLVLLGMLGLRRKLGNAPTST